MNLIKKLWSKMHGNMRWYKVRFHKIVKIAALGCSLCAYFSFLNPWVHDVGNYWEFAFWIALSSLGRGYHDHIEKVDRLKSLLDKFVSREDRVAKWIIPVDTKLENSDGSVFITKEQLTVVKLQNY